MRPTIWRLRYDDFIIVVIARTEEEARQKIADGCAIDKYPAPAVPLHT